MKEEPKHVDEKGFDIEKSIDESLAISRTVSYPRMCSKCYAKAMAHMLTKPGKFNIHAQYFEKEKMWSLEITDLDSKMPEDDKTELEKLKDKCKEAHRRWVLTNIFSIIGGFVFVPLFTAFAVLGISRAIKETPWWSIAVALDIALVAFWIFNTRRCYRKIVEEGFEWEDKYGN